MARYIDAELLKEVVLGWEPSLDDKQLEREIDTMPTADVVEVVRCSQCQYAEELDKHCEVNRGAYKHCSLWRGDETRNVWHKYKKYYRDYSIVEEDGFCSEGRRKENNEV
jgi:hypothetical protein